MIPSIAIRKRKATPEAKFVRSAIGELIDRLRDWRDSPFEQEGPMRQTIRANLCLAGIGWAAADATAVHLLGEAFQRLDAKRPSWEQGQRGFVDQGERCQHCGVELGDEARLGNRKRRYCSTACAEAALVDLPCSRSLGSMTAWSAAKQLITQAASPERDCRQCGKAFRPPRPTDDTTFCSMICAGLNRRLHDEKACLHCGDIFRPKSYERDDIGRANKFCTYSCYAAERAELARAPEKLKPCLTCGTLFKASAARVTRCSPACAGLSMRRWTERACELCGVSFYPKTDAQRFCGAVCAKARPAAALACTCRYCGIGFEASRRDAIYCCREHHERARWAARKIGKKTADLLFMTPQTFDQEFARAA